jgi:hypothetical protein
VINNIQWGRVMIAYIEALYHIAYLHGLLHAKLHECISASATHLYIVALYHLIAYALRLWLIRGYVQALGLSRYNVLLVGIPAFPAAARSSTAWRPRGVAGGLRRSVRTTHLSRHKRRRLCSATRQRGTNVSSIQLLCRAIVRQLYGSA